MRMVFRGLIGLALAASAVPALAGEQDCLASANPAFGAMLVDEFLAAEGLGDAAKVDYLALSRALDACFATHAVAEQDEDIFREMNVSNAFVAEMRARLVAQGVNVDLLDRQMALHIRSADSTFDDMMAAGLGPEFEKEVETFAYSGKVERKLATAMVGSYAGAFHSARSAQLRWDARR